MDLPDNAVLFKMDVAPLSRVSGAPKIEDCLPSIDTNASYYIPSREIPIRYFKCRYCDVIQKEFHSHCPNCGAPMEVEDEYISKAKEIKTIPSVGESYTIPEVTYSKPMISMYRGEEI